jgi:hypothetical protein
MIERKRFSVRLFSLALPTALDILDLARCPDPGRVMEFV